MPTDDVPIPSTAPVPRAPWRASAALRWLIGPDADPAIRWQALRALTAAPDEEVESMRAKVAVEGWGAQLVTGQDADGFWHSPASPPEWVTLQTLLLLRDMGLDPTSREAGRAGARVRDHVTWQGTLPQDAAWHGNPFFVGEVEPCINGRVVAVGAYFGEDVQDLVDRLLGEQLADGGWNCERERGSTRGSFHTTICVLEGLLEYERAAGDSPAVTAVTAVAAARERGHEFLLARRLLRRLTTDEEIDPAWSRFSFPTGYHYDVLRGLDYLRSTGMRSDGRLIEALEVVAAKRGADGRWPLENPHPDELDAEPGVSEGQPSRWNTLRALRVLAWFASAAGSAETPR